MYNVNVDVFLLADVFENFMKNFVFEKSTQDYGIIHCYCHYFAHRCKALF